jgi:thiamine biosynthesis protein ThiS
VQLTINGESRECSATTVDALLHELGVPLQRVAVEHNGAIVPKAARATTMLTPGDTLEVVTLVGGG